MSPDSSGFRVRRPDDNPPAEPMGLAVDERTLLESFGLTKYETEAYLALLSRGIAEAKDLSRASGVPTSKIYETMTRLESLGLVEIQATRPRKFMARDVSHALAALKENKKREFEDLVRVLPELERRLGARSRVPTKDSAFWSVAVGWEDMAAKHLRKVAEATEESLIYVDITGSFGKFLRALNSGGPSDSPVGEHEGKVLEMMREVRQNLSTRPVPYRFLVGASSQDREAAQAWVLAVATPKNVRRFRLADPGRPAFHVIDKDAVVMVLQHPARPVDILGSVYVQDPVLAREARKAFEEMWGSSEPLVK